MGADFAGIMRNWDDLKQVRLPHEGRWQKICDVFLPGKDMTLPARPGELRQRTLSSSVPQVALRNHAALLVGYLIDHTRPFILPNVERGLINAGRSVNLSDSARDALDTLGWQIRDRMMLPQSGFLAATSRIALELPALGTGVQWIGRKRGFGPRFQARPLRACWIAENADGEVDTLYFAFTLSPRRVIEAYPEALKNAKLAKRAADNKPGDYVQLLHVVEPRQGGKAGAVATAKPFVDVVLAVDDKEILTESGWDSFPFQVPRMGQSDGSPYGDGLAWLCLPEALVYNAIQEMTELGLEKRVLPEVFVPTGLFGGALDRRVGAVNYFDPSHLGFLNARDLLQQLQQGGDVNLGVEYMSYLAGNIERVFFTDWMRLMSNPNMTATQTLEIRDMQLRGMSSLVPAVDRDWFGRGADRILEIMAAERSLDWMPRELAGLDVDWDYAGPLAIAQRRGEYDIASKLIDLAARAKEVDEEASAVLSIEDGLRAAAEALAAPPTMLRSREYMAEWRQKREAEQQAQMQAQQMQMEAATLRDGAQGVETLARAVNGGGAELPLAA